jgi:hypothetical protein
MMMRILAYYMFIGLGTPMWHMEIEEHKVVETFEFRRHSVHRGAQC